MWFEVIPSLGIIVACLHLPQIATYASNLLLLGTPYSRSVISFDECHHYLRDMRISGKNDAYIQKNLDCFEPEVVPEEKKCECP